MFKLFSQAIYTVGIELIKTVLCIVNQSGLYRSLANMVL